MVGKSTLRDIRMRRVDGIHQIIDMYQSNSYEYLEKLNETKLLICKDDKEAASLRDVAMLLEYDTFVLPDLRVFLGEDLRAYDEDVQSFLMTLAHYYASESPNNRGV